jgi:cob(I)alamin adenosyltransferase
MHYEKWAKQGIPTGSGAMESTCGQFQTRLKGPGKFWTASGKDNIAALDAARTLPRRIARRNHEWEFDLWGIAV